MQFRGAFLILGVSAFAVTMYVGSTPAATTQVASSKVGPVANMSCKISSPISLTTLMWSIDPTKEKVSLVLDLVEGRPRDKVISRSVIDTHHTSQAELGAAPATGADDKIIIYQKAPDGAEIAATASLASLQAKYKSGAVSPMEPKVFEYQFIYSGEFAKSGQTWNLVVIPPGGKSEIAFVDTTCSRLP